jgi:hypothetical protein
MKWIRSILVLTIAVVSLSARADLKSRYLITVPHTPETCLKALDETEAQKNLGKWDWGCGSGDHTGYLIVETDSDAAALSQVPPSQRAVAKVQKLNKFTAAEVRSLHSK